MLALSLFSSSSDEDSDASAEPEDASASDRNGRAHPPAGSSAGAPSEQEVTTSIISRGATVEGLLDFEAVNLRVEGTVHGDITTDARVVVAEGAEVEGTIRARTVRVAGSVEGRVLATEQLVLCPSSEVHATLEAEVLEIQPGADFSGEVPETKAFVEETSGPAAAEDATELISASSPSN